ncbi:hypothetical protein DTL70_28385 [Streptomyces diacarni]|uniref:GrpB family protein n=1 Tax=Streptomyces diacarni TaxID=2800381 RepID=A0A367EFV9_9ACTN|nr:GrpB family protein [Streptomyces diacarni]RCG16843.1 hypothetical protein DTL70_28385 [Streptomyces diacarni]
MAAGTRHECGTVPGTRRTGAVRQPSRGGTPSRSRTLVDVRAREKVRSHILHVVTLESWPTRNQRILRDQLRAHPEDAARYANLKRAIVDAGTPPAVYARAKTALVQELTDRARAQLGLPPVPVWEKQ